MTYPPEECGSEASAAGVRDTLEGYTNSGLVRRVMSLEEEQALRKKLLEQLEEPHCETDLIQMEIDTGNACPKKQPARMPFAVRQEVATQLKKIQENIEEWSDQLS